MNQPLELNKQQSDSTQVNILMQQKNVGTGGGVSKLKFSSEANSNTLTIANNARVQYK